MAKLTEAEARRICAKLGIWPDHCIIVHEPAPALGGVLVRAELPAWEVVQRAAQGGGDE